MERILQSPMNSFWKNLQDMYRVSELVYPPLKSVWPCLYEFLVQQRDETIGWRGAGCRYWQFSLGWGWLWSSLEQGHCALIHLWPSRLSADNKWNMACNLAAIRLQPLPKVSPEKTQDVKMEDTGSRELSEVHIKGMISVSPDSCTFPYIEWC